jgi:hypothetical protein
VRIHQDEIFNPIAHLPCESRDSTCDQFVRRSVHQRQFLGWNHIVPIVVPGLIKLCSRL